MEKKEPFSIAVNGGQHEFALQPEDAKNLDIVPDGTGNFQILHKGRSFHAELLEANFAARLFSFRINGEKYTLHISDHYERLVQHLGLSAGVGQKQNIVKAPMPGLVLNIMVEPGQVVQKGDPLLILEAMKMENVIKAAGEGHRKKDRRGKRRCGGKRAFVAGDGVDGGRYTVHGIRGKINFFD